MSETKQKKWLKPVAAKRRIERLKATKSKTFVEKVRARYEKSS